MRRSTTGLSLLTALLAACAEPHPDANTPFDTRMARLREVARIDGYAQELVPIGAVALRDDGVIAISQVLEGRVRFFSENGSAIASFGQRGEGPAEFIAPGPLGWRGDSLWVFDGRLRRLTWIAPSFELVPMASDVPISARPPEGDEEGIPRFAVVIPLAPLESGSLVAHLVYLVDRAGSIVSRDHTVIGRLGSDGIIEEIILALPPSESAGVTSADGASSRLPLGNFPRPAIAPDGRSIAFAMASLSGPSAGTFELTAVTAMGDTLFSRRLPFEAEAIPAQVRDSVLNDLISRLQDISTSLADAVRREGSVPPLYPPIAGLSIANDGTYWIELREKNHERTYYVVGPDGSGIGTARLPRGSRVAAANEDVLWVLEPDRLDVPHLVRYELSWE